MKFLCLPGAFGSAKNFKIQLDPFVTEAERQGTARFTWTQGTTEAIPPAGFEDYFGAGPLYRFIDYDGVKAYDIMERIRYFPEAETAEDTIRLLMDDFTGNAIDSVKDTVQRLIDIIDADPEIEGILGYSEGATTAATVVLEERHRLQNEGRPRRIKRAIFFAGWAPLAIVDGKVKVLLMDESEDVIDIPTLHVVGCNDPYIQGAITLFNMCAEEEAEIFDHGKGHTVPRDQRTIWELCDAIGRLVKKECTWGEDNITATGISLDALQADLAKDVAVTREGVVV
ncbi:duf341 domain containing protein [Grosmannia clavigera kw1407]|uniref:Duf341 domain containing protein n=1 Tax=Grosmannia clavigera (strain kw1407 / UAMH 11150) TaxID=655863 RepID=F0XQD4_GROCL|nr:duf341 domain containing protein [Grosmannia clavigera kw1407]EFX00520.1 duf341 domain containing protein [Grosmannia clavigera kw1407]